MATLVDLYHDTLPGLIGTRYQTYGDELLHGIGMTHAPQPAHVVRGAAERMDASPHLSPSPCNPAVPPRAVSRDEL